MRVVRPASRPERSGTALAAATLTVLLSGCGGSPASDRPSGGPWSFTDGSGGVVSLDHTPTRIIAHAGEAAALLSFGIRPVGIYADQPPDTDPDLVGLDLTGIEVLERSGASSMSRRPLACAPT